MSRRQVALAALLSLIACSPPRSALAQYMYLDLNGDGLCDSTDVLTTQTTAIDVWLDSEHNADGSTMTCIDPGNNPTPRIKSYFVNLTAINTAGPNDYGTFEVHFDGWTNNMLGFGILNTPFLGYWSLCASYAATDMSGAHPGADPGLYKLGTAQVSVYHTLWAPRIDFGPNPTGQLACSGSAGFSTECQEKAMGKSFFLALGVDFMDHCGTSLPVTTAVQKTTWGRIKDIYR